MSKLSLIHSTQQAGPNTEIYGPRSVKTRIRTVVRKFPYSDRLFELSELATILTCFDKKKLQQFFSNTLLKRKKATDKGHKIPKRYRRDFELKFCGVKSKK